MNSSPRSSVSTLAGVALALTSSACGGNDPADNTPPVPTTGAWPLELVPLDEAAPAGRPPRIVFLGLPAELDAWKVPEGTGALRPGGADGTPSLLLREARRKRVLIPGPIDPRGIDLIALELSTWQAHHVSAHLVRDGWGTLNSKLVPVGRSLEPKTIEIALPQLHRHDEPFDQLVLSFLGDGPVSLRRGVSLVDLSRESLLPPSTGPPQLVESGGEARRAVALAAGSPLLAETRVGEGAHLILSLAIPHPLALKGNPGRLLVAGENERGVRTELDLPLPVFGDDRWKSAQMDLASIPGDSVRLRFELVDAPTETLVALAVPILAQRSSAPATVLLVTSDTHRADHLGASGMGVEVETPALDALAARGVLFEDCFSSTNVTNPSHIALMTATSPRETGITNNYSALSDKAPTLAEEFARAGYMTLAATSARHLEHATSGLGQGFARMASPNQARDAEPTIDFVRGWLDDVKGVPIFVWLHLFDAHGPYAPPEPFLERYWPAGRDAFDPALPADGLPQMGMPPQFEGLRDPAYPGALYRGEVSYLDHELGRLLELPRIASGIAAVTADHGESFGAHGIYYDHGGLYPDTIHVPLVLAWPAAPAGTRVETPVRQIDLGATLLELAGAPPGEFPGRSLLDSLEGEADRRPRYTLAAHREAASITWNGWHLVLHLREHKPSYGTGHFPRHQVELYRLADDPGCERSLVEAEPEIARRLWTGLVGWLVRPRELDWLERVSQDHELMRELAKLGYVAGKTPEQGEEPLIHRHCGCDRCAAFR
ncbi:MAG: sulfatase [Planctomycetota bacterium]|jgi:arylsulfatase A-like enzyme|nr:sulfatase [Planctomycetota bacterium]